MKKTLLVILCSLSIGGLLAYYIFNKTIQPKNDKTNKVGIAFQIGVYSNYDNALNIANENHGIVIKDNNIYRVYVSLLTNDDAIKKLKTYYDDRGLNYYLKEIEVSDDFIDDISIYEEMINKSNIDTYDAINNNILSTYLNYV